MSFDLLLRRDCKVNKRISDRQIYLMNVIYLSFQRVRSERNALDVDAL